MQLLAPGTSEPFWFPSSLDAELSVRGTAISLSTDRSLFLLSYGDDPMIVLPNLEHIPAGSILRVHLRIRVGERVFMEFLRASVDAALSTPCSSDIRRLLALALTDPGETVQKLDKLYIGLEELCSEMVELRNSGDSAMALRESTQPLKDPAMLCVYVREVRSTLHQNRARLLELEGAVQAALVESAQMQALAARNADERDHQRAALQAVLASWSWRFMAPLRSIGSLFVR